MWPVILLWAAVILFVAAAFGVKSPRINLMAAGLACFAGWFLAGVT